MKFNTFFAFMKLSFSKKILTSNNNANIRLLRIQHKTALTIAKKRIRLKKVLPRLISPKVVFRTFLVTLKQITQSCIS